jgi:hypothetical protein
MEAPDGVTLTAPIGPSDRGELWRAQRRPGEHRVVRFVDPRFCDGRFQAAVRQLRTRHQPGRLEIVGESWVGARYAIEYAVDAPFATLGELYQDRPKWMERLRLLALLCDGIAQWQRDPALPLSVGLHNVVVLDGTAGRELRLVPCPPISLEGPHHLFGMDPSALSTVAPEVVRGVPVHERAQDRYALGTLTAHAVGWSPSRLIRTDADRVQAQARGALLVTTDAHLAVESALRDTPRVRHLLATIRLYRHPVADARPAGTGDLRSAIGAVTDLVGLATELRPTDPDAAIEVLGWADEQDRGERLRCRRLAARFSRERGDLTAALAYLDEAVGLAPDLLELRRERAEVLWTLVMVVPAGPEPDRAVDLAADLRFAAERDTSDDRQLWLRLAEALLRAGELYAGMEALYDAVRLDESDLAALQLYAQCLAAAQRMDAVADVVQRAQHRLPGLVAAGRLREEESAVWQARFRSLLG